MKTSNIHRLLAVAAMTLLVVSAGQAKDINWAEKASVSASSYRDSYVPEKVQDGVVSDASRWLAAEDDSSPWIELAFPQPITVGMIDVFSGWKTEKNSPLASFDVDVEVNGVWQEDTAWEVRGNKSSSKRIYIDRQKVSRVRLALLKPGAARIREIAVYDNKEAQGLKDVGEGGKASSNIDFRQHQIAVNQVGYFTERPKRFTAPLSADGTVFKIRAQHEEAVLFSGGIENGIGDFSAFKPADEGLRYVIDLEGGDLKAHSSDPFLIRKNIDQEQYWQAATDFLNDVRSVTGTHPSAYGGCSFRDGTYYDAIVPALVKFYLADPEFVESMPRQIDWEDDKERVTAGDFVFIRDGAGPGVMDAVRNYYEMDPPNPNAPDVVKLIHWGAGYILMRPNGRDPSASVGNEDSTIEPQTVEQVAYVLWAWPALKKWLPRSFYDQCRDFCFNYWKPEGGPRGDFKQGGSANKKGASALDVSPWWDPETYMTIESFDQSIHNPGHMHPFKGRHAPGHSIVPNLLMHEVALREGREDADIYLDAAVKQAEWIIQNLDWKDPRTTKGHRLSEHRTIPNLVWLLQKYPEQAPVGLKEKITEWARVAVSRSHNLWDFRKFSEDMWTIPGMNEVGNSLSVPAIAIAASWVVDDPALKKELERVAFASIDHVFGRNPMLAAATSHPKQGFPEIERGWPKLYKEDVCARLETVRGNIATLPGSEMYPFQPGKRFRHLEGWANYGASWCISLSYLQFDAAGTTPDLGGSGGERLKAPPEGYTLVWSDEFDGDALDLTKWVYRTDSKHWSTQTPENVTVSNGMLLLRVKKESLRGKAYTGAGVISSQLFKYGYYESRFRVPPGAGWHTSFWLMKHNAKGGTGIEVARQEIDICEQDSVDPFSYTVNLHDWEGGHENHKSYGHKRIKTEDLSASFHVWGCEFTAQHIRYYVDGNLVQEQDATRQNHGEHNIWLTTIASHLYQTKAVDDTKLPSAAVCDYVRFYEKKASE